MEVKKLFLSMRVLFLLLIPLGCAQAQQVRDAAEEQDGVSAFRYTIVAETSRVQRFVNSQNDRRDIFVLLDDKAFNETNLRLLLKLLSDRYEEFPWFAASVFTSLEAVPTPEEFDRMGLYGPRPNYRDFKYAFLKRDPRGMTITYQIPGEIPSRHIFVGPIPKQKIERLQGQEEN
jgi:hypothetical protein